MIKYEDIVKRISTIEKKKIKNEERIKTKTTESEKRNVRKNGSRSCRFDSG